PESRKVMRAFLARWALRKLPASKNDGGRRYRLGGTAREICRVAGGLGQATIQRGRYLSHRRGYAGEFGLVELRDRMVYGLLFRYRGSAEEALRVFASPEFQADLTGMISGRPYVTPAAGGIWSSFCKTQYANDPRCGGWNNFARAHLGVLAVLEHLQGLGFRARIRDEGGFWEKRDVAALGKALGESDVAIAGMIGALKEQARESGMTAQSAMDGRGDFEHLEAKAQEGPVGRIVSQLRGI
ncbi:MAG: hypothetical protein NT031_12050, partial [Planctomycetota bacterium]|nr:hypothetical protein [Planctomycetota bacterium]